MVEERIEFKAEVSKVLDIVINSLYSNKEIFLRELKLYAATLVWIYKKIKCHKASYILTLWHFFILHS